MFANFLLNQAGSRGGLRFAALLAALVGVLDGFDKADSDHWSMRG